MSVLRRFPVSDEFISYRQTLDSVCDRMIFFETYWAKVRKCRVASGMTLRIDWKCSRVSTGPASGRNPLLKCGLDTSAPFFRVSGK